MKYEKTQQDWFLMTPHTQKKKISLSLSFETLSCTIYIKHSVSSSLAYELHTHTETHHKIYISTKKLTTTIFIIHSRRLSFLFVCGVLFIYDGVVLCSSTYKVIQ